MYMGVIVLQGCIFSIEEFSVYDGPGIRTTVFLKGCPLHCSWCHNPEGQAFAPQIVRSPNGCMNCGSCIQHAQHYDQTITYTQQSIVHCPQHLLRWCGESMESTVLCDEILKNRSFLENGGVTFSGGEPLSQSAFLLECLSQLKGQLHTAVQTSGYADEKNFTQVLELADYMLFDLKLADDMSHRQYTGVSNRSIHRNLQILAQSGKPFVIRIPLIPGVTDTDSNMAGIIRLLQQNHVSYVELLPYNLMAGGKYAMVGRTYSPGFDQQQPVHIPEGLLQENKIDYVVL